MIDVIDIKPCPFCGSKHVSERPADGTYDTVACLDCGANITSHFAVKHWNTRALADGWISARDQPPPTDEPVVYCRPKGGGKYNVGIAYWCVSNYWIPEIESQQAPGGYTHWKPLGKPPTD